MDCENCWYYDYDEEYEDYVCIQDIDEDEMERISRSGRCPYYKKGDEYTIAHKQ